MTNQVASLGVVTHSISVFSGLRVRQLVAVQCPVLDLYDTFVDLKLVAQCQKDGSKNMSEHHLRMHARQIPMTL